MDFNRKDHIVVTIAETGEKKHLLKSRIRSVAAADAEQAEGPAAIIYAQDDETQEPLRLIVAENETTVVSAINGEPTLDDITQMERDIIRERQEESVARLRDLDEKNEQPDVEIEALQNSAQTSKKKVQEYAKQIGGYERGTQKTWRGQLVEWLYLREAAEKRARDPFNYHLFPDSTLLKVIGYGMLTEIKTAYDNKYKVDYERGMQNAYFARIEQRQQQLSERYQRERENLLRLRDEPHMTFDDRAVLEQRIREHTRSHEPKPEYRFVRDEKAAAYRPAQDIAKDREQERQARARDMAEKIREARQGQDQGREEAQERARELSRGLTRGRGRDRGGPDYSR